MKQKPVVLMILDGYGLNDNPEANAIAMAKTPVVSGLMENVPFVKGYASGMAVGLPDGQMGNSEVGHMNMGAGRIVYQELTRITKEIQDGVFFNNPEILHAINNCKVMNSDLHIYGLLSDGGVHSHTDHLYAILEMCKKNGLDRVYVDCFLDGRDTPPQSGIDFIAKLETTTMTALSSRMTRSLRARDSRRRARTRRSQLLMKEASMTNSSSLP